MEDHDLTIIANGLKDNAKKLLKTFHDLDVDSAPSRILAEHMGTSVENVTQYAYQLSQNGLLIVQPTINHSYSLTDEGKIYAEKGLPERQLLNSFNDKITMKELQKHPLSKIGVGWLRKKGWVTIKDGIVYKTGNDSVGEDEHSLKNLNYIGGIQELVKRNLVHDQETRDYTNTLTSEGKSIPISKLDYRDEVGTLTRNLILSGEWKNLNLRRYDVTKLPRVVYCGKSHPYQRLIEGMRQIFLEMGFTEIHGGLVQSSFWNFDALFQPQDHPAREMQDTFYLKECMALPGCWESVKAMHENGGETTSTGWGGVWKKEKAEQCVLRTHTTSLSIQHLAAHPEPPVKAFCIDRVYRREAIDPTHTPEFEQLEGIVMDKGVGFTHLLGFLKEFYQRMGFEGVRFRPGYFPYTEPSVEPEVWVDGLGWVEMGGAGIFRQEVTAPFGIRYPVLAWGLGVSRVAMLRLGLKDLRLLYRSDISWIRDSPVYRPERQKSGGDL